ncbi:MAG: hypothetical protein KDA86_25785 [Planctomycetaceae bacterium]|nr:hypothetical protein [Planctomycetaceae bacterium]
MILTHWLRSLSFQSFTRSRIRTVRRRRQAHLHSTCFALEKLEERTLLTAGTLDLSFGTEGVVVTNLPDAEEANGNDVAIQADGKIVAVGQRQRNQNDRFTEDIVVTRYNQDGSLDTSFGNGGIVILDFGTKENGQAVAIDDQDRIIVAGNWSDTHGVIVRLQTDGSLDTSFSDDGRDVVAIDFHDIEIQDDGKIVAVGAHRNSNSDNQNFDNFRDFGIVRYNVDGSPDTTFGTSGIGVVHTDFATPQEVADASGRNESAFGVTIDPLGRIIAVGQREAAPVVDFAVARYLPDGTLDGSFGSGGTLRIDTGSSDSANEVVVDGNGKIVFVGRGASIVRLNDDGSFDTSFGGGDGVVSGSFFEFLDVVLQDDGKLITSGRNGHAGVFRFNTDGSLDTTFGTAGGVSVDISGRGNDTARGVALQADGKMVFVGVAPNEDDPAPQNIIGLARLLGDNIPPTINGLNFDVVENLSSIGMVTAADDDLPEDALTFSITGDGADDPLFTITADGALSFLAAPDYENPLDVNGDNTYEVEVRVTDNVGASAVATMTVNVLNQIATISGTVFVDVDGDGLFDGGTETALDGVTVELLDSANSVLATDVTELGGVYAFTVDNELGTYRIRESQPTGVDDGAAILGNAGGTVISSNEMEVTLVGDDASDYDFTEVGQAIQAGDTATIGFWQNKHGQSMISQGGPALVSWLNANFGNIFGSTLTDGSGGDDAAEVASFYKNEFFKKKLTGTSKVDAQFMATALATFFTSSDLSGGNVAAGYGFNVTETGIGTKVLNVGTNGAAFGVVDNTNMTIMSLLLATNSLTDNDGVLNNDNDGYSHVYDVDGDGDLDEYELSLRAMANTIYSTLNEQGDI